MSDELERRLREAGHRLPGPTDHETRTARARVLDARARRPRRLVPALVAVVALAGAFGVGYAVASGGSVTKTKVVHVKARLDAGPGFLPDPGWTITGSESAATARSGNGTRIAATFAPASTRPGLRQQLLPLQLPNGGAVRRLRAHVGAYAVDVTVRFGTARPSPAVLVAAREELGRLVVASCPNALPLAKPDAVVAAAYVRMWLPAHYPGKASDVVGAVAVGHVGAAMPRRGEAAADCGARVAARSVEVDVTLRRIAKMSASLSQLTYFVAKTSQGWTVWERAR